MTQSVVISLYVKHVVLCICTGNKLHEITFMVLRFFLEPNTHVDGLVQNCYNSSTLAMELLQSCIKPSIYITALYIYHDPRNIRSAPHLGFVVLGNDWFYPHASEYQEKHAICQVVPMNKTIPQCHWSNSALSTSSRFGSSAGSVLH